MKFYSPTKNEISEIIIFLCHEKIPEYQDKNDQTRRSFRKGCNRFHVQEETLFYKSKNKLLKVISCDDDVEKGITIATAHSISHFGRDVVFSFFSEIYHGIKQNDVNHFISKARLAKDMNP